MKMKSQDTVLDQDLDAARQSRNVDAGLVSAEKLVANQHLMHAAQ
jgi:hypothetical protein